MAKVLTEILDKMESYPISNDGLTLFNPKFATNLKRSLNSMIKLEATNVHRYLFEQRKNHQNKPGTITSNEIIEVTDKFNVQTIYPPWDDVWIECSEYVDDRRSGCRIITKTVDEFISCDIGIETLLKIEDPEIVKRAKYVSYVEGFSRPNDAKGPQHISTGYILYNENKDVLAYRPLASISTRRLLTVMNVFGDLPEGAENWDSEAQRALIKKYFIEDNPDAYQMVLIGYTMQFMGNFYALMLCHCKNVSVEEGPEPSSKVQKSRKKHNKSPLYQFKVIDIETVRKKYADKYYNETSQEGVRLHLVRGHFKRYTEEKPLFGKFVGTVWIPTHMRGNIRNGVIEKEYNMGKVV